MDIKLFKPYALQKQFIDRYADTEDLFGVVSAPRGSGKTLLAINLLLYWLLQKPNQKGGWISPVYQQAKSVMDQIVSTSKAIIDQSNRMEGSITLINGSTIKFLSSDTPDNIRGFRFTHLILDEVAFIRDTALNTAILPTLNPSGKKCLMISTPKGKNHFYNWFIKDDVVAIKFPLSECPYINQELVQEARQSLPPDIYRQEFLAEFVDSSNDVFTGIEKVSTVGMFSRQRYQEAYVGIDTGLSDDFSVMTIISPTGRVLWVETINNRPLQSIADIFMDIMSSFKIIGGYIECNGIGKGMADLIRQKYRVVRELYMSQDKKMDMIRKLISDIETMTVELPCDELVPELHKEMSQYTFKLSQNGKLSFSHPPGGKDDHIDSLLLANYSRIQFMHKKEVRIKSGGSKSLQQYRPIFDGIS